MPGGFAVRAGVKKPLSLLLVMSGTERECLGVLELGSAGDLFLPNTSGS